MTILARARENEILRRFGICLAGLELTLPRHLRAAARDALLLERAHCLAAARAQAAAERQAVRAGRTPLPDLRAGFRKAQSVLTVRRKFPHRPRRTWRWRRRLRVQLKPGG